MEIAKKIYIKGSAAAERLANLKKLAEETHRGNFSEMIAHALDLQYGLDPETGRRDPNKKRKPCKHP